MNKSPVEKLALIGLALLWVGTWFFLLSTAGRQIYFEPTTEAIARAAAATPAVLGGAAAVVIVAAALVAAAGRRSLAVLALPGLLAAGGILVFPPPHGAAFMYALVGTVLASMVLAGLRLRRTIRRL